MPPLFIWERGDGKLLMPVIYLLVFGLVYYTYGGYLYIVGTITVAHSFITFNRNQSVNQSATTNGIFLPSFVFRLRRSDPLRDSPVPHHVFLCLCLFLFFQREEGNRMMEYIKGGRS